MAGGRAAAGGDDDEGPRAGRGPMLIGAERLPGALAGGPGAALVRGTLEAFWTEGLLHEIGAHERNLVVYAAGISACAAALQWVQCLQVGFPSKFLYIPMWRAGLG